MTNAAISLCYNIISYLCGWLCTRCSNWKSRKMRPPLLIAGLNSAEYQHAAADMAHPTHSAQQVSGVTRHNKHIHSLIRLSLLLQEATEREVNIWWGRLVNLKDLAIVYIHGYIHTHTYVHTSIPSYYDIAPSFAFFTENIRTVIWTETQTRTSERSSSKHCFSILSS